MAPINSDTQGTTAGQNTSSQQNYDFFLNPPPPPKKPLINLGASSLTKRIVMAVGGIVGLIIVVVILSSLLGNHTNFVPLISVAQDQNELIRVATEGVTKASIQTTENLASNIELTLTTDQLHLLDYLTTNKQTVSSKVLDATKDSSTDQALTTALAESNYDTVFIQTMQSGLTNYYNAIKSAYQTAGSKGKALLKQDAASDKILINQANAAANSL